MGRRLNPLDSDVYQIFEKVRTIKPIEGLLLPYEYRSQTVAKPLASLLVKEERSLEALGYAHQADDRKTIEIVYESLKMYPEAFKSADDDQAIKILRKVIDNLEETEEAFERMNNINGLLGLVGCNVAQKKCREAVEILKKCQTMAPQYSSLFEKMMFLLFGSINSLRIESFFVELKRRNVLRKTEIRHVICNILSKHISSF